MLKSAYGIFFRNGGSIWKKERYLDNGTGLREDVVDGVDGDPHHGGEADEETNNLGPLGIVIVRSVFDGLVWDAVEAKNGLKSKQI